MLGDDDKTIDWTIAPTDSGKPVGRGGMMRKAYRYGMTPVKRGDLVDDGRARVVRVSIEQPTESDLEMWGELMGPGGFVAVVEFEDLDS